MLGWCGGVDNSKAGGAMVKWGVNVACGVEPL